MLPQDSKNLQQHLNNNISNKIKLDAFNLIELWQEKDSSLCEWSQNMKLRVKWQHLTNRTP